MHLTDLTFKKLRLPEKGRITYNDDAVPGLGVRVSASGVKSFVLLVGRSRKRITIGRYPTITLAEARAKARELLAQRILGKEDLPIIKFEDAVPLFLASHYPEHSLKPRTRIEAERIIRRHFLAPFRYEPLHTITTHEITEIIDGMKKTPSEARHAFAIIRVFFNWAERRRYVPRSPCWNVHPPKSVPPRERVLSRDEIKAILAAAHKSSSTFATIVELLLYTGQRRAEIVGLRHEWIDWETRTITFPAVITKNKRTHRIPFGARVETLLRDADREGCLLCGRGKDTPFGGWSKCKATFDKLCPLPHWTLHDLRRTFATNLAALGVPVHITEKALNHVSGTTGGIVAVYQRHTYENEVREAMAAWERYLMDLTHETRSVERVLAPALQEVA